MLISEDYSVLMSSGGAVLIDGLTISGQTIINAGRTVSGVTIRAALSGQFMAMSKNGTGSQSKKPASANQLNQQIKRGQAPRGVKRVDNPDPRFSEPHVHFEDGTSITQSGKVHDAKNGVPKLTNEILDWLHKHGWCLNLK